MNGGKNLEELNEERICPLCGKQCGSKRGKEGHMVVKHGIKNEDSLAVVDNKHPWACPYCDHRSKDRAGAKRHMTRMHNEIPEKKRLPPIFKGKPEEEMAIIANEKDARAALGNVQAKEVYVHKQTGAIRTRAEVEAEYRAGIEVVHELKPVAYEEPKPEPKQEEDEMRGIQKGENRIKKMEAELQKLEDKKSRILGDFTLAEERAKQAIEKAKADLESARLKSVELMDGINDSLTEGQKMIRFAKSMLEEMKN